MESLFASFSNVNNTSASCKWNKILFVSSLPSEELPYLQLFLSASAMKVSLVKQFEYFKWATFAKLVLKLFFLPPSLLTIIISHFITFRLNWFYVYLYTFLMLTLLLCKELLSNLSPISNFSPFICSTFLDMVLDVTCLGK